MKRKFILEIETDYEYTFDELFQNIGYAVGDMVHPENYHVSIKEFGEVKDLLRERIGDEENDK